MKTLVSPLTSVLLSIPSCQWMKTIPAQFWDINEVNSILQNIQYRELSVKLTYFILLFIRHHPIPIIQGSEWFTHTFCLDFRCLQCTPWLKVNIHSHLEDFPISLQLDPTWLNQLSHTIACSSMVNAWSGGTSGSILPTFTLWKDRFDEKTQFIISNPDTSSPLWSKETSSPALLLNETPLRKWWS